MKYIIEESQINNVMFWYLDNQDFIRIEKDDSIYFVNSEGDGYAQIRYNRRDGWCLIGTDVVKEISSFFSLEFFESKEVISRWVENTLQMKITNTYLGKFV